MQKIFTISLNNYLFTLSLTYLSKLSKLFGMLNILRFVQFLYVYNFPQPFLSEILLKVFFSRRRLQFWTRTEDLAWPERRATWGNRKPAERLIITKLAKSLESRQSPKYSRFLHGKQAESWWEWEWNLLKPHSAWEMMLNERKTTPLKQKIMFPLKTFNISESLREETNEWNAYYI